MGLSGPSKSGGTGYLPDATRDNPYDPKSPYYSPPAVLAPVTPLPSGGALPKYLDTNSEDQYRASYLKSMKPNYNFNISSEANKPTSFYSSMSKTLGGGK